MPGGKPTKDGAPHEEVPPLLIAIFVRFQATSYRFEAAFVLIRFAQGNPVFDEIRSLKTDKYKFEIVAIPKEKNLNKAKTAYEVS